MQPLLKTLTARKSALALLLFLSVFASGCTSELWDQKTFAHRYQPADPANLRLYYSDKREDILVQYDELKDPENTTQTRCYWLGQNMLRENPDREPHFVSAKKSRALTSTRLRFVPTAKARGSMKTRVMFCWAKRTSSKFRIFPRANFTLGCGS